MDPSRPEFPAAMSEAIRQAREGRKFRGREAVICLGWRWLFVQNIRVPQTKATELDQVVRQEAESRLPFPMAETVLDYVEAGDVRQGDAVRREVIVLACHRPVLDQALQIVEDGGLRPIAVDVEPAALWRCYGAQFRRDDDHQRRTLLVHVGHSSTAVLVARGDELLFIKYLELGGRHLDEAVAAHLNMDLAEAWALRRHNGDRRADQQDPIVARSVAESVRPVLERLASEVALCVRYHSVTFRGQQIERFLLGGGEASHALLEALTAQLQFKGELGDPLRSFTAANVPGRRSQWDVATGLAMRETR
jgi:type IV pilus assembly protein PilM